MLAYTKLIKKNRNMAPCKQQVKARKHLVCDHFHSMVDFAISWCGKSWSETTEKGFTFQCIWCWKVDRLTEELARLTDIVKGMEMRVTKQTYGIESDGK